MTAQDDFTHFLERVRAGDEQAAAINWAEERPAPTELRAHEGWLRAVAFNLDGFQLVSGDAEGHVQWWDAAPLEPNSADAVPQR